MYVGWFSRRVLRKPKPMKVVFPHSLLPTPDSLSSQGIGRK